MESLFNSTSFNPQCYASDNIPQPTDRLYTYSGYLAGLMTNDTPDVTCSSDTILYNVQPPLQQQQPQQQQQHYEQEYIKKCSKSLIKRSISTEPHFHAMPERGNTEMTTSNIYDRYSGMYATTGFDILSVLARVVNRSNPQINLGPVDLSSSIVVADARQYDFPIIYASPTFERLTGYSSHEIVGRNCRFLQAPDGSVAIGSKRRYTDNNTVYHIKTHLTQGKESQASIVNYKKSGQPFVNLLTVIPVSHEFDEEISYFVAFQVDLVEQPNLITQSMKDGTYMVNYRNLFIPPAVSLSNAHDQQQLIPVQEWTRPPSPKCSSTTATKATSNQSITDTAEEPMPIEKLISEANCNNGKYKRNWEELLLEEYPDFMHVLTIKGIFLYCSDSVRSILGYETRELEGKSISTVCHPSDITTVLRELKQSSSGPSEKVNIIYRLRHKSGAYLWMECIGRLHNEDGRGRKYIVLSGRERPVYQLTTYATTLGRNIQGASATRYKNEKQPLSTSTDDHEVWCKLSADGLVLYASWTCANILGYTPNDIIGVSMYQFLKSNRTTDLTRCLAETKEGKIVYLQHTLLNNAGIEISVASTFYPDGFTAYPSEQPSFVLMHIKMAPDTQSENQEPILVSLDLDVKKQHASNSMAKSQQHDLGEGNIDNGQEKKQPQSVDGANRGIITEKIIKELDIKHKSNWQYELHQLRINNNRLRGYLNDALKKKKERSKAAADAICQGCLRRLAGPKELIEYQAQDRPLFCNTCILR
ncbi:white collar one B [Phascolomyces articulosus]|uniref:White collar one B n=1 Tax=Phascolomyces articulosus TaxID=60185 RepID=A0AAD5K4N4_9FUNG|nr:white collar one B [Phascolomyces articulosus]